MSDAPSLTFRCVPPSLVSHHQRTEWLALLKGRLGFDNPLMHPQFFLDLETARRPIEIGIASLDERPVGFFPFERHPGNTALSPGIKLSDIHGPVVAPGIEISSRDWIKGCRLNRWEFDHLLAEAAPGDRTNDLSSPCAFLDLSQGYDAYIAHLRAQSRPLVSQGLRKLGKVERRYSSVRIEDRPLDSSDFQSLLAWKHAQRVQTGTFDVLAVDWVPDLLKDFAHHASSDFSGLLSSLYFDDHLVAVHYGIRTDKVLHCWFVAYNHEFQKESPGLLLFLKLAEQSAARGIVRMDLGRGDEPYKQDLASGHYHVLRGSANLSGWRTAADTQWLRLKKWVRSSRLRAIANGPRQWFHKLSSGSRMQTTNDSTHSTAKTPRE